MVGSLAAVPDPFAFIPANESHVRLLNNALLSSSSGFGRPAGGGLGALESRSKSIKNDLMVLELGSPPVQHIRTSHVS